MMCQTQDGKQRRATEGPLGFRDEGESRNWFVAECVLISDVWTPGTASSVTESSPFGNLGLCPTTSHGVLCFSYLSRRYFRRRFQM